MLNTWFWKMRYFARRLWVRAVLLTLLALLMAALAPVLSGILPGYLRDAIDDETLSGLLSILTNSMLTVATFSLGIMVTAHLSADKGVTPRSHRLLQEDARTQTVLATFIGAFVYALTLTVMQNVGFIEDDDAAVVYIATVGVIIGVVVAILRWVAHLDGLGSVEETARRVEERAFTCIDRDRKTPFLGAEALLDPARQIPKGAHAVHASDFGYVQNVDTSALSEAASDWGRQIILQVLPGHWVNGGDVIALVAGEDFDTDKEDTVRAAFTIGDVRLWDQDSTFGLIVLAEIAERALSPGINDPRTALDILTRLIRLTFHIPPERPMDEPDAPGVLVPPMDMHLMLEQTFDRIARDGRTFVEVQLQVQRAYAKLESHSAEPIRKAARDLSRRALAYAEDGLLLIEDLERVGASAIAPYPAAKNTEDEKESAVTAFGEDQGESHDRKS